MKNILYADIRDELKDKLDDVSAPSAQQGEFLRQKKQSETVLARAISAGMIEIVRSINHVSVPSLIQTVDLKNEGEFRNVYAFQFPTEAVHERSDAGVISFVLNGEQVDFSNNTPYEQVVLKARMPMYTGSENLFNVNMQKRRLYAACIKEAQAVILKRPHSAFSPSQNMFHGVQLKFEAVSGGTIEISDGHGQSVSVEVSGTVQDAVEQTISAVNEAENFSYNATEAEEDDTVQLYIRYDADENIRLKPTVADGGAATITMMDSGTYEIPIPYHFINTLAQASFDFLIANPPDRASDPIASEQEQRQRQQSENQGKNE